MTPNQTLNLDLTHPVVIFDWDGTLMNSMATIVACLQYAARKAGLPDLSEQQYRSIIGLSLPIAIHTLWPEAKKSALDQAEASYRQHFLHECTVESRPFAEAESVLQTLHDMGAVLAVATGKSRPGLNKVLKQTGFDRFFITTQSAEETASKPDPKMLQEILDLTGASANQCVMVGDTSFDLEMAANIHMPSIGVAYGCHTVEQLNRHSPVTILQKLDELVLLM